MYKSQLFYKIGLGLSTLLLQTSVSQAASIQVVPTDVNIKEGNIFDIELEITELGNNSLPSLSSFDLDIGYDSNLLTFNKVNFGDPDPALGDQLNFFNGSLTDVSSQIGFVNVAELSLDLAGTLDSLQSDSFVLATLSFQALSPGISDLTITVNQLGDSSGIPLTIDSITNGQVTIESQQTPESSSLISLFMILGLAGLTLKKQNF